MDSQEELLRRELAFMYNKYEELCIAYKKAAIAAAGRAVKEVHDMSHMTFKENDKEIM